MKNVFASFTLWVVKLDLSRYVWWTGPSRTGLKSDNHYQTPWKASQYYVFNQEILRTTPHNVR
mgnify:CR=1 FL=1